MRRRTRRKRYKNLFIATLAIERRQAKGYAIAERDTITEVAENTYLVPSKSRNRKYRVQKYDSIWRCECPDCLLNEIYCKHIHAAIIWRALKKLEVKIASRIIKCKSCGSTDLKKDGQYRVKGDRKQWYKCMVCGKQFSSMYEEYKWIWEKTKIMAIILDLRFKGFSTPKITAHLKQFYKVDYSPRGIADLVLNCGTLLQVYAQTIGKEAPDWITKNIMIKVGNEWFWLWNAMSVEAKFLLASLVREGKSPEDAKRIFLDIVTSGAES